MMTPVARINLPTRPEVYLDELFGAPVLFGNQILDFLDLHPEALCRRCRQYFTRYIADCVLARELPPVVRWVGTQVHNAVHQRINIIIMRSSGKRAELTQEFVCPGRPFGE